MTTLTSPLLTGLHHVTAIASDPQKNIDFYAGVLGLRLVKKTVNFDDPGSYHLYYGDASGTPGTLLTFFAWPGGRPGRRGLGQITTAALSVPADSLAFWQARLAEHGVRTDLPETRFGETSLPFYDPDGMRLALVPVADDRRPGWTGGTVSEAEAIRGLHSVTAPERRLEPTASLLTETLGFRQTAAEGDWTRYTLGGSSGTMLDLHAAASPPGQVATGSIHHVAWAAPDDPEQAQWLQTLTHLGASVSPIMDREYFYSIYFREPGGILFEIATNTPGFLINESLDTLGTTLQLPPQYESMRAQIEAQLPPVQGPKETAGGKP